MSAPGLATGLEQLFGPVVAATDAKIQAVYESQVLVS